LFDKKIIALIFLNGALYCAFLLCDFFAERGAFLSAMLKYCGIAVCLCIAAFAWRDAARRRDAGGKRDTIGNRTADSRDAAEWTAAKQDARLQTIVLGFTLIADYFLLFTPFFAAGILIFFGAHLTALRRYQPRWFPFGLGGAIVCVVAAILRAGGAENAGASAFFVTVSIGYGALIIAVTAAAFLTKLPYGKRVLAQAGMVLFMICDINVIQFNTQPPGSAAYGLAAVLMWAFYLPAQTALALSACHFPEK
jgi:hypothetical protein